MAIPDYQSIMLPLLKIAADGEVHRFRETAESLAGHFALADGERRELLTAIFGECSVAQPEIVRSPLGTIGD